MASAGMQAKAAAESSLPNRRSTGLYHNMQFDVLYCCTFPFSWAQALVSPTQYEGSLPRKSQMELQVEDLEIRSVLTKERKQHCKTR